MKKYLVLILFGSAYTVEVDSRPLSRYDEEPLMLASSFHHQEDSNPREEPSFEQSPIHQSLEILTEKVDTLISQVSQLERQQREFMGLITDLILNSAQSDESPEQEAYQEALDQIKRQQFSAALTSLQTFLERFPKSEKTPLAYYWIGEIHTIDGKFDLALQNYDYLVTHHPKHPKTPEALFKIGQVYQAKGDKKKAQKSFQQLIELYPQSISAQLAKDSLASKK